MKYAWQWVIKGTVKHPKGHYWVTEGLYTVQQAKLEFGGVRAVQKVDETKRAVEEDE
jgi:hypothetical protein